MPRYKSSSGASLDPNQSLQVSSQPKAALGFAVFAVASFWFIRIFPLG